MVYRELNSLIEKSRDITSSFPCFAFSQSSWPVYHEYNVQHGKHTMYIDIVYRLAYARRKLALLKTEAVEHHFNTLII